MKEKNIILENLLVHIHFSLFCSTIQNHLIKRKAYDYGQTREDVSNCPQETKLNFYEGTTHKLRNTLRGEGVVLCVTLVHKA